VKPLLSKYQEETWALLRIVSGFLFLAHGTQKLFGWPGGKEAAGFAELRWFAGVIETVGGAMIALGFYTAVAAFIASGTMAVAYFKAHASGGFLPIINRGELAVLYCFLFFYMSAKGSGIWSVDSLRRRGRR
jgi:putative oxidoreductase